MKSLFVATPMYGGQCFGAYTDSMMKLVAETVRRGIQFRFFPIFNESHVDRARFLCADEFLRSDFSHMLFIDADIQFKAEDALQMLKLAEPDKDVICGFYPKKVINWKAVVAAVRAGYADEDPEALEHFVADMVYTPSMVPEDNTMRSIYDLTPLHEGGTGFMMIQRHVFERVREANPHLIMLKWPDKPQTLTVFFDAKIDPDAIYKRFLSEDYDFCRLVRNAGMKVWLAPWINLTHHGYWRWIGNIEALAAIQNAKAA